MKEGKMQQTHLELEELRKSIDRIELMRSLERGTPALICRTDINEVVVVYATPLLEKIFGYIDGELVGKNINILIPEGLRSKHDGHVAKYLASPQEKQMGNRNMRLIGLHRSGTEMDVEIGLYPFVLYGKFYVTATILVTGRKNG